MKAKTKFYRKLVSWFAKRFAARLDGRLHRSVDTLPIYNWWEIHRSHDLSFLFREQSVHGTAGWWVSLMESHWDVLYNDYITRYGFGRSFLRLLEKRILIADLINEKWSSGDLSIQTMIDIENHDLERMQSESSGESDFYKSKAEMERLLGFTLDPHRVSVAEFNSYISSLQNQPAHVVR